MTNSSTRRYKQVSVQSFGGPENLEILNTLPLEPSEHEVIVDLTSIGVNQADLMARRGEYRLSSGEPPFTPGIEGGGVITAVGTHVTNRQIGQKVILTLDAPMGKGTYRSQFAASAAETVPVPEGIANHLIGALWLPFVTAWGALVWRQNIQPGQVVLLPAASSSVAIAASQIVKHYGGITIGTTTSPKKIDKLNDLQAAQYDHLVVVAEGAKEPWWRTVKKIAQREEGRRGVDVIFDPIAAGNFLHHEIRILAPRGTLWIYGLLGAPDTVDVSPLIRKNAAIRGWLLNFISSTVAEKQAYQHVLSNIVSGTYTLPVAQQFSLDNVREAHRTLEQGNHIGKFILVP